MQEIIQKKRDKRILKEKENNLEPSQCFFIQPLKTDLLTWHFTIVGLPDSPYKDGIYHGYIKLPQDYPMSPPDIYFCNESGRYQTNTKICLNMTSYHKDTWTPAWSLKVIMEAFTAYFFIDGCGIGSLRENDA